MNAALAFEGLIKEIFGESKAEAFEGMLLLNGSRMKGLRKYIEWSIAEGIILMVCAATAAALLARIDAEACALIGAAAFFAPLIINHIIQDIIFEKRKRKKEEMLPDLLLEASVFCDETSLLNATKRFAEQDFGILSEDFARAKNEISNGASIEEAYGRMKELNKSKAISRTADLLLQGYRSGARMSKLMKEAAEDILESQAILRERQAVMLVTKYTLLLSAGLIVPAILGLIIGLVGGMNFDAMGDLSLGLTAEERKGLFSAAVLGTNIYVAEYALLSSFFLALQEGNKKQFWVYGAIMLPVSLGAFFMAQAL